MRMLVTRYVCMREVAYLIGKEFVLSEVEAESEGRITLIVSTGDIHQLLQRGNVILGDQSSDVWVVGDGLQPELRNSLLLLSTDYKRCLLFTTKNN